MNLSYSAHKTETVKWSVLTKVTPRLLSSTSYEVSAPEALPNAWADRLTHRVVYYWHRLLGFRMQWEVTHFKGT